MKHLRLSSRRFKRARHCSARCIAALVSPAVKRHRTVVHLCLFASISVAAAPHSPSTPLAIDGNEIPISMDGKHSIKSVETINVFAHKNTVRGPLPPPDLPYGSHHYWRATLAAPLAWKSPLLHQLSFAGSCESVFVRIFSFLFHCLDAFALLCQSFIADEMHIQSASAYRSRRACDETKT